MAGRMNFGYTASFAERPFGILKIAKAWGPALWILNAISAS